MFASWFGPSKEQKQAKAEFEKWYVLSQYISLSLTFRNTPFLSVSPCSWTPCALSLSISPSLTPPNTPFLSVIYPLGKNNSTNDPPAVPSLSPPNTYPPLGRVWLCSHRCRCMLCFIWWVIGWLRSKVLSGFCLFLWLASAFKRYLSISTLSHRFLSILFVNFCG